jgi:hypothetical protein
MSCIVVFNHPDRIILGSWSVLHSMAVELTHCPPGQSIGQP